uniref:Uncharacterized protein n=1 Tax=Anguilla anguilla TaxID=7936 RepID=A0A0E9W3D3_ANGAN
MSLGHKSTASHTLPAKIICGRVFVQKGLKLFHCVSRAQ